MNGKPSIVLCHGIWADGSSFSKLIPTLRAEGYETITAQYGLDTNEGDVEATLHTLGRVSSPAILVGHSYGGSVITAAGTDDRVAGLVYISALAPDEDETTQSQLEKFPVADVPRVRRARRWPALAASRGRGVLRRRSLASGEGSRVGDPVPAGG